MAKKNGVEIEFNQLIEIKDPCQFNVELSKVSDFEGDVIIIFGNWILIPKDCCQSEFLFSSLKGRLVDFNIVTSDSCKVKKEYNFIMLDWSDL